MLNILGLNINHADSAACIIKNNSLIYAIEEERINIVTRNSFFIHYDPNIKFNTQSTAYFHHSFKFFTIANG